MARGLHVSVSHNSLTAPQELVSLLGRCFYLWIWYTYCMSDQSTAIYIGGTTIPVNRSIADVRIKLEYVGLDSPDLLELEDTLGGPCYVRPSEVTALRVLHS